MTTTPLGTFTIENATRYETADLLAVVSRVEACAARAAGGRPRMSRVAMGACEERWGRGPCAPVPLRFTTFGGTVEVLEIYDGATLVHRGVRWIARFLFNQPTRVRLVPPERLHVNALEAVVLAAATEPRVPASMVAELAGRIQDLYQPWDFRYDGRRPPDVDVSDLRVRFRGPMRGSRRRARDTAPA
jgi:hypothetical protein